MKILINAQGANVGGALRHLTHFLPELGRHDIKREYVVLVSGGFPLPKASNNIRLERMPYRACSSWARRIFRELILIPKRLREERFSALVSLTNFGPISCPVPHIIFQRNSLYYCRYYLKKIRKGAKLETLLRRRLAVETMKRADLIVTPTHAMKCMIQDACPAVRDRPFYTLYHGFDRESLAEPLDVEFDRHLSASKGVKLLYPTHPAPHKGFEVLFDMLVKLKSDGSDFRLFATISVDDWPQGVRAYERRVEHLGLKNNVVFLGRVPQQQMASVYKKCDLMIYPSLCESFGFSMLEAMGYGLPIVAADTAVNREVCEEAARYYPPLDPVAGAKAVREALEPSVMDKLREAGRRRITSTDWSWGRYAREFVEMIEKVT